jgi:hypothetical protein
MEQGKDFTFEPFRPRDHGPRSDKGKSHNYPKVRRKWMQVAINKRQTVRDLGFNAQTPGIVTGETSPEDLTNNRFFD